MVRQVVCNVVQRTVHHAVEVENQEARVGLGGSARSADLAAMPSARAAACAASPRTGVRRHARVTESIFTAGCRRAFIAGCACAHGPAGAPAAVGACALLIKCVILVLGISGLRGFGASQYL